MRLVSRAFRAPRYTGSMRVAWLFAIASVPGLADSLGVLPFWNSGANPQSNLDWIGESVAESIRDAVGSRGVVAIEREDTQDAFHRLGLREHTAISEGSILKLGEELDAEQIVYGTFEFTPSAGTGTGAHGSLKIAAKILDLKRGVAHVVLGMIEEVKKFAL